MKNNNTTKMKIVKLILFILAVILLITLTVKLFPLFLNLGTTEGREYFKSQIDNSGFSGIFMLLGLQLLQILIPVLPGEPIEFLAGMCYGTIGGMLIIFLGAFLSSVIIFFCVRKLGKSFITTFFGEGELKKLEHSKMFSNPDKIEIILFILFLIPGTPKDLFTYIAGLLPIKPLHFLLISTFCRFPSVITSTFAGSNLADGNITICIIAYVITFAISGIGLAIYKKMNSKKNQLQ